MCIRVCVRIAYLQACKAIDSENKIKQQSPTHTRTHTQTLPFTHTCTHSSTHSLSCSTSPFLSLSHSLALQHNEGNWAESLPLAVFCNLTCDGGGGRALQQATTSASTQQVAAQRYARQSTAQRSVARACCCSGFAALSHFAFHILTQRKAARLCPPPRAAFAVDFQCEMKSRGWWTCVRFHGSTVPPQCISISSLQSSSASTDTCGTSKKTFADICEQKM